MDEGEEPDYTDQVIENHTPILGPRGCIICEALREGLRVEDLKFPMCDPMIYDLDVDEL